MSGLSILRPLVTRAYLAGRAQIARAALCGPPAQRSLERVCIVSALGRRNGITTGAVLQYRMLRQLGIEVELVDATASLRNPLFRAQHQPASAYIFHCGAPQTASLISAVLPTAARAWRVGYWAWELPDPPRDWRRCDRFVHEIWTPSEFATASLARLTRLPVRTVPHYMTAQIKRQRDWSKPFTVLTFGDSRSSLTRKNLAGSIKAFRLAFGDSPRARMLLKVNAPDAVMDEIARLVQDAPNIVLLRDFLEPAGLASLYQQADVLLSLHRAEGFGLPLMEAMTYGIPVVATGWSGNLEFTDRSNSVLVPYRLVPVVDPAGIYGGSMWAEPYVNAAALALRRLASDREYYDEISEAAYTQLATGTLPTLPSGAWQEETPIRQAKPALARIAARVMSDAP